MDAHRLVDLEEIKQLKARYFRLMDTKQWPAWGDLFTEDCTMQSGPAGEAPVRGRDAIVAYTSGAIEQMITVHHGHMPEIEFTGADDATGVWAMVDRLVAKDLDIEGWGHYHETYRRCADGRWRIASTRLTRLRVESSNSAIADGLWPEGVEARKRLGL